MYVNPLPHNGFWMCLVYLTLGCFIVRACDSCTRWLTLSAPYEIICCRIKEQICCFIMVSSNQNALLCRSCQAPPVPTSSTKTCGSLATNLHCVVKIMSNLFTHHPNALGKEESFYSWVQGVGERNFALGRWVKNGKAEKPWQKARWSALRRGTWRKGDAERGGMSKAEGVWWSELGQVRWNARLHCELQFAKPCRSADPRTRSLGGACKAVCFA